MWYTYFFLLKCVGFIMDYCHFVPDCMSIKAKWLCNCTLWSSIVDSLVIYYAYYGSRYTIWFWCFISSVIYWWYVVIRGHMLHLGIILVQISEFGEYYRTHSTYCHVISYEFAYRSDTISRFILITFLITNKIVHIISKIYLWTEAFSHNGFDVTHEMKPINCLF